MSDPSYLVKINNVDITPYLKYPGGYKVQRNKLWTDAGRNLAGSLRATFIGLFPKLLLEFRNLTSAEMETVCSLLDNPSFSVSWWDPSTQSVKSGTFYSNDFEPSILALAKNIYEPFSVHLIPFDKLT